MRFEYRESLRENSITLTALSSEKKPPHEPPPGFGIRFNAVVQHS